MSSVGDDQERVPQTSDRTGTDLIDANLSYADRVLGVWGRPVSVSRAEIATCELRPTQCCVEIGPGRPSRHRGGVFSRRRPLAVVPNLSGLARRLALAICVPGAEGRPTFRDGLGVEIGEDVRRHVVEVGCLELVVGWLAAGEAGSGVAVAVVDEGMCERLSV